MSTGPAGLSAAASRQVQAWLEAASLAVWEARRLRMDDLSTDQNWAEWRRHVRAARDALAAADDMVTRYIGLPD